jgi:hypothetical protein
MDPLDPWIMMRSALVGPKAHLPGRFVLWTGMNQSFSRLAGNEIKDLELPEYMVSS